MSGWWIANDSENTWYYTYFFYFFIISMKKHNRDKYKPMIVKSIVGNGNLTKTILPSLVQVRKSLKQQQASSFKSKLLVNELAKANLNIPEIDCDLMNNFDDYGLEDNNLNDFDIKFESN